MRTLIHLSDLHFGRLDHALLAPLRERIAALAPDVVVVSGDLTQRARASEFRDARAFLDTLPSPQIVVPGNHDVPLYNAFKRFLAPLGGYRRYIARDIEPAFMDDEIAIVGVNTARSLTFKGGRINRAQIARVRSLLCDLDKRVTRVVVTHHPFDVPATTRSGDIVGRAPLGMEMLAHCGADILLAGHLHRSHSGNTAERYRIHGYAALVVQAGTATSTRARGEANSFNVLQVAPGHVSIARYEWQRTEAGFAVGRREAYERTAAGWARAAAATMHVPQ